MSATGDVHEHEHEDDADADADDDDDLLAEVPPESSPPVLHSRTDKELHHITHAAHDLESSDDERPGRFYGPDSTWRWYTREERALAATLDQAGNNDLSIHLYNAHKWKQSLRRPDLSDVKVWNSKRRWLERAENGTVPFHPGSNWTAWPMRPADVPRNDENWGVPPVEPDVDQYTYRRNVDWKPSQDLQDLLQAEVLRQAKERFRAREWQGQSTETTGNQEHVVPLESKTESGEGAGSDPSDGDDAPSSSDQSAAGSVDVKVEHLDETAGLVPSFTADDEAARKILQPSVRHVIGKLDDILVALHHSRKGHRRERSRSRDSGSRSRCRPQTKRTRENAPISEREDETEPHRHAPAEAGSRCRSRAPRHRQHRLGTRDWSEVLGMASMVGWEQSVVDRASRRCAALFEERMTMRTMPEATNLEVHDEIVEYSPDMIPPVKEETDTESECPPEPESQAGKQKETPGFFCPYSTCKRHMVPYPLLWRLREHLKRESHRHTTAEIAALEQKGLLGARRGARVVQVSAPAIKKEAELEDDAPDVIASSVAARTVEDLPGRITIPLGRSRDKRSRRTARRRGDGETALDE